jgi:hypothetical protein
MAATVKHSFVSGIANGTDLTVVRPLDWNADHAITGTLDVVNGGTAASTASITSFNNITGYTAAGATGTTSTNLVFSTSPTFTTSINSGATFTAFAGATTSLTIGGTGATSVFAVPGTLEQSSTTGAMTVAGGVYIAKKLTAVGGISGGTF